MTFFWEYGQMCIRDLVNCLPEPKPHYNTVATLVKFLEEKGFVVRRPVANTFLYSPAISEKEYRGETIGSVVRQYYNNSYMSVVSQFVEEEKMDLDELRALIAEIDRFPYISDKRVDLSVGLLFILFASCKEDDIL